MSSITTGMGRNRRDSGHRNKLYDDSSGWGLVVVVGIVVFVIALILLLVWLNLD